MTQVCRLCFMKREKELSSMGSPPPTKNSEIQISAFTPLLSQSIYSSPLLSSHLSPKCVCMCVCVLNRVCLSYDHGSKLFPHTQNESHRYLVLVSCFQRMPFLRANIEPTRPLSNSSLFFCLCNHRCWQLIYRKCAHMRVFVNFRVLCITPIVFSSHSSHFCGLPPFPILLSFRFAKLVLVQDGIHCGPALHEIRIPRYR